jgi:predicted dehydrogenase
MIKREKVYNVGILGNCCTHGEFVAAAIKEEPNANIVAGWESDEKRKEGLSKAIGMSLKGSGEELIGDKSIDIVAVSCSPHEKAYWIEMAAKAGKHLFLNKPMCESLDSAVKIENTIKKHDVRVVYDISVIKSHPVVSKILREIKSGIYGIPIHYSHSWSFTFSMDFPLQEVWPERLDPPNKSGGGEVTNLGCYAVDYMISLWGRPKSIQAKVTDYWRIYKKAKVENFGQIVADYGDFFAFIASGKQPLQNLPSMDVNEALNSRNWHNVIEIQFENHNLTIFPFNDILLHNGKFIPVDDYIKNYKVVTAFQQLINAIEKSAFVESNIEIGRLGVEVLMAAYTSAKNNSVIVPLPLQTTANPLIEK